MKKKLSTSISIVFLITLGGIKPALATDQAILIPEVSLKPQNHKDLQKKLSAQTTHINRKKIVDSPDTTMSGILQKQSALRLTNNSGDNSQTAISLRGFGDNAVANSLILVDGFPLMNPSLLAPNINSILLSDIENIEIFQGSQGTLYGNQAVGGVLNIITRHPKKRFGDINLSYGSYNSKFFSGIYGDKLQNGFFFKIMGYGNDNDNFRIHNQNKNQGFSAQEGIDYSSGTIAFNQKLYDDNINFPGLLNQEQYDTDPSQATNRINRSHSATQIYQLFNKQALNDDWMIETWAAHNDIRTNGFIYSPFNSDQWLNSLNPQLVGSINNDKFIFGYYGQSSFYQDINTLVRTRARSTQNDFYGQSIFPLLKKWNLTLGARSAQQDNTPEMEIGQPSYNADRVFVTEQGIDFHPSVDWSFFLRRDGNFRFPKANEEVWLPLNVTTLKPQTGVSYETGIAWDTFNQKTQLSLYQLNLHNEIAFDPVQTPLQPFGAVINFSMTKRQGITLTEDYRIKENLSVSGQLNYVNARFASGLYSGNFIPAVPAWNGNINIEYEFLNHWKISNTALYTGSAYASEDVTNCARKTPSYWLDNPALQYYFKNAIISFEVNNLFNQHYAVYTDFDPFTKTLSFFPGIGRNYLLIAKIKLV